MLRFTLASCALLMMLAFALVEPQTTPNAQQTANPNSVGRYPKKKMLVLREQGRKDVKPTQQEVRDFHVTRQGRMLRQIMTFGKGRRLLKEKGVPFEPNILLDGNWRERLRNRLATVTDYQVSRREGNRIQGAQIAHTLVLPERVELTGDTVILAKNLVFEGRNVLIKGNYDFNAFVEESTTQVEPISSISPARFVPASHSSSLNIRSYLSTVRVIENGQVTVDTSGSGRREWLESRRQISTPQAATPRSQTVFVNASFNHTKSLIKSLIDDTSGQPGADGQPGISGRPGVNGTNGANGADGSCSGNRNGEDGIWGTDAGTGERGENGRNGGGGDDAGNINVSLTSGASGPFIYTANGGDGGRGGQGGFGGNGGFGGVGGDGGDGADCLCVNGGGGAGGDAGFGGDAGNGGDGGNGGNGGRGGSGGTITITYPSGFNSSNILTSANPGVPGASGGSGSGGYPGSAGRPGRRGEGSGPFDCRGGNGGNASYGAVGEYGDPGPDPGTPGTNGSPGDISITCADCSGGGGSTYCEMYPSSCSGGGGSSCTPWFWVYYESIDGGQTWYFVDAVYAGCW